MTEKDYDKAYAIYDKIYEGIDKLVDKHTKGLPHEMDDFIRTKLLEEVRFWRDV
jgi:hypothetical protein